MYMQLYIHVINSMLVCVRKWGPWGVVISKATSLWISGDLWHLHIYAFKLIEQKLESDAVRGVSMLKR